MGKILTMPPHISAYSYKSGVSIPTNANDIVIVDASHLDVSNLSVTDIKNFFGVGTTNVSELCKLPQINPWSNFRPTGNAPYMLGDFAGYNHYALPPSYVAGMTNTAPKTYESSSGKYPFTVGLTVGKGEKTPATSWGSGAVKFTYNGTVVWKTIDINSNNYASAVFKALNGNDENVTVNVKVYYTANVSAATPGAVALAGYDDGHWYGLLIEDPGGDKNYTVALTAVSSTLYCNFTGYMSWDSSKRWIAIAGLDPAGYTYTFSEWTATNGSFQTIYTNYAAVNLVTVGGIRNSGDFSVKVTASYPGMVSVSQVFALSIRNNALTSL